MHSSWRGVISAWSWLPQTLSSTPAAIEVQAGGHTLPETEMVVEEFVDMAPIWMEVSPLLAVATGMSFDN